MKLLIAMLVVLFGAGILAFAMGRPPRYHPGGPYYYRSWVSYVKPYRPTGEITEAQANELDKKGCPHYVAYFDEQGRILSFTKCFHGEIVWREPDERKPISETEAVAIARHATSLMKIPPDAIVSCAQKQYRYIVTFKMQNPPRTLGADYYAQVHIDGLSKKVIKLLVTP